MPDSRVTKSIDVRRTMLIDAVLPEFGEPTVQPTVPPATYRARMQEALKRAAAGLDGLVVYGDREQAATFPI